MLPSTSSTTASCTTRSRPTARGRVCQAGFLGGLDWVEDSLPIFDLPSGVQFSFGSFEIGGDAYPLSLVPFQEVVEWTPTQ